MNLPPQLFTVFAADEKRAEPIAAFTSRVAAENWARTMARDFRRGYVVVPYVVAAEWMVTEQDIAAMQPVTIEPPVATVTSANGQLPPLQQQPGSRHADKTKPGRRVCQRRDSLNERKID